MADNKLEDNKADMSDNKVQTIQVGTGTEIQIINHKDFIEIITVKTNKPIFARSASSLEFHKNTNNNDGVKTNG